MALKEDRIIVVRLRSIGTRDARLLRGCKDFQEIGMVPSTILNTAS